MKTLIISIILIISSLVLIACQHSEDNKTNATKQQNVTQSHSNVSNNDAQKVNIVKYESLLQRFENTPSDSVLIVNFWATWCKPYVQELPYFKKVINSLMSEGKPLNFVMVTLDTKDNLESSVLPFLEKNQYQAEHYLLDDNGRMNEWIPKFSAAWEGEIPATAIYKNGELKTFHAGQLSEEELEKLIADYF